MGLSQRKYRIISLLHSSIKAALHLRCGYRLLFACLQLAVAAIPDPWGRPLQRPNLSSACDDLKMFKKMYI